MAKRVLVLMALAGLGATAACGGGRAHGTPSFPAGAGAGPLPTTPAEDGGDVGTCAGVSYRITAQGVEVPARVATAPAKLNIEADDQDDNPVTGDPATSGVTFEFTAANTPRTMLIKGVTSLDHVTVIALGTARDDSCRAYRN